MALTVTRLRVRAGARQVECTINGLGERADYLAVAAAFLRVGDSVNAFAWYESVLKAEPYDREALEGLARAAERTGVVLTGPNNAFLIHGDDRQGALVDLHQRLSDAHVNVYASDGVTDGRGGYGYVLYVRPDEYETAAGILNI